MTEDRRFVQRLWGSGDLELVFSGQPRVGVPWPSVHRRQIPLPVARDALEAAPHLVDLDPRELWATQGWVLHQHAAYYVGRDRWETTGVTSADRYQTLNRYPLVVEDAQGRPLIAAGHHRSLAALLEGRSVRARIVRTDAIAPVAVLPRLLVGTGPAAVSHEHLDDSQRAADAVRAGITVVVPDGPTAVATMSCLGLDEPTIADRLAVASIVAGGEAWR